MFDARGHDMKKKSNFDKKRNIILMLRMANKSIGSEFKKKNEVRTGNRVDNLCVPCLGYRRSY